MKVGYMGKYEASFWDLYYCQAQPQLGNNRDPKNLPHTWPGT